MQDADAMPVESQAVEEVKKLSRKERKKLKKRQKRREEAKHREEIENEEVPDDTQNQVVPPQDILEEEKKHAEEYQAWLERERQFQEEFKKKKEEREQRRQEWKKKQELRQKMRVARHDFSSHALKELAMARPDYDPTSDPRNCPFYLKTGACKYGASCKRFHSVPAVTNTIMFPNMCDLLFFVDLKFAYSYFATPRITIWIIPFIFFFCADLVPSCALRLTMSFFLTYLKVRWTWIDPTGR